MGHKVFVQRQGRTTFSEPKAVVQLRPAQSEAASQRRISRGLRSVSNSENGKRLSDIFVTGKTTKKLEKNCVASQLLAN